MKIEVQSPNSYTRQLNIHLLWEDLEKDFSHAVKHFGKHLRLPGFRSGKVPKKVLLTNYRPNIEAEFMESNFQKYYQMALEEEGLVPVNQAEIGKVDFAYESHLSFQATFEVEPELKLPKLRKNSLKVKKTQFISDEEDVELAIEELRREHAEIRTIDDGAKEGHFMLVDLQKLDDSGVPIIGQKVESQIIRVGEGAFTDTNLDRLVGLKPGGRTRVDLPEGDGSKTGTYELSVKRVDEQVLPEVNLDFIKLIDPDIENEESWRVKIKERIDDNYAHRVQETYERDLSDALIDYISPEFAPSMVDSYLDNLIDEVRQRNKDEEINEQKVRETYRPVAERNIKWYMIRNAIVKEQEFKVSSEELDSEITRLMERSPDHAKEIQRFYRKPSNRRRIEDDLMEKKVLEYLNQFVKVREVKVHTRDLRKKPESIK